MLDTLLAALVGWHFLPHIALILPCICFHVVSRSAFASTFCTTGTLQRPTLTYTTYISRICVLLPPISSRLCRFDPLTCSTRNLGILLTGLSCENHGDKLCDTSLSSTSASHVFFTDAFDLDRVGKIQFYTIARYDIPDRRRTQYCRGSAL